MYVNSFTTLSGVLMLLLVMRIGTLNAQVRTKRFGQPQNLESHGLVDAKQQLIPTLSLPAVDAATLLLQDEQDAKNGLPFRFGINQNVSIDLLNVSAKDKKNDNHIYQYRIDAAGAFSVNLIFSQFQLKKGAKLFLYNGNRTMIVGPITEAQNPGSGNPAGGEFWTDLVQGSNLTIELQEPIAGDGRSELHLSSVVHGYKNTFPDKLFGQSGVCHPNMVCFPANQFEGDGVALILLANGSRLCTGSMVNTMRQSFRSFFQSAFHCVDLNNNGIADASEITAVQNWLVRFNYQSATCAPGADDFDVITLNNTTYRAGFANSDFTLLELTQQVPLSVNTTYNGWNRAAATTSNNFGIHHPRGDVKKISFTNAGTQVSAYGGGAGTTHLISFWGSLGVTDPGSSGSPLFDGNRRIVGQLHGGPSFCGATGTSLRDYYGRFFTSWTGGGTNSSRLSNWLDPDNSSNTTTDGVKPAVSGPATVAPAGTFALNTLNTSVVSWSVTGGAGLVLPTSGAGNSANLTALGVGTSLTISFSVNDGQAYPIQFSKVFSTSVAAVNLPPVPPVGGIANQTATAGVAFNFTVPAFTDPNGDLLTYTASGLPANGLIFSAGTRTISGTPSTTGSINVIVAATDPGSLSASASFAIIVSPVASTTTVPPSGTALTLLPPTYNCATGAITFNPVGGDGTTLTYSAVGVQRASATSNTGTVEAGLRSDPKPLVIVAFQSGVTVSQTFDFAAFCGATPPISPTVTPGGALSLLAPAYICATGAITFNVAGGDGSTITYTAVGVQRASATSNTGTVEAGLRSDPKPLVIVAFQSGVTVSQTFDFAAFCGATPPISPTVTPGGALSLLAPTYICATGAITFNVAGGDGTTITYTAVGVQRASATSNTGTIEPGLRADPKPLIITATQSGNTASITFNFGAFCAGTSRLASTEPGVGLSVRVLGNPTADEVVSFEVRGAEGKSLNIQTLNVAGQLQSEQRVKQAGAVETVRTRLGRSAGMYLIQVQAGADRQTVRVVKE